jgi:CheY-like chemotaxis protein
VVAERKTETTLPINTSGARVLIVDDNVVNRRILTEQLSMWGFDTVAAESGPEGLAVLSEANRLGITVDAIVLDYHMPEMNGLDFARSLRGDRRFDRTGVIFLTSMDMASDESMFAELQIHAHLMKPARANLLRSTVIDVVRSVRSRQQMETAVAREAIVQAESHPAVTATSSKAPVEAMPSLDVLVAEDNEVNQIVFTQILQTTGWLFQIVRNGSEAVEAWQANDPALILMDVSMPVMNGHQATKRIRELEKQMGTHTPIIGVTAHALESDRELCFQAGMDDYLSKPISPEALEEKIRTWIGGARLSTRSR